MKTRLNSRMIHRIYLGVTVQNISFGRQAQTTQHIRTLVQHQTILRRCKKPHNQKSLNSGKLNFWLCICQVLEKHFQQAPSLSLKSLLFWQLSMILLHSFPFSTNCIPQLLSQTPACCPDSWHMGHNIRQNVTAPSWQILSITCLQCKAAWNRNCRCRTSREVLWLWMLPPPQLGSHCFFLGIHLQIRATASCRYRSALRIPPFSVTDKK